MSYYDMLLAKKLAGGGSATLQEKSVQITANGDSTILPDSGYDRLSKVDVSVNVSGGGEAPENDVEFIDYDGTIVYSYTAQEFLALTEMPANPTHEGLTAQGWNWSLADAKEYVGDYGKIDIGQTYITDNGKTRIYISLGERRSPYLGFGVNGTADIDWGDGTEHSTLTGTNKYVNQFVQHEYATPGDYVIQVEITGEGTFGERLGYSYSNLLCYNPSQSGSYINSYYANSITKIEIGNNISEMRGYSFSGMQRLNQITIPKTTTSIISQSAFASCKHLNCVVFPSSFTFASSALEHAPIKRAILGANSTLGARLVSSIALLQRFILPTSPSTSLGAYAFNSVWSLSEIIITKNIESISDGVFESTALKIIKFTRSTPPIVSASSAFSNLPTDCVIYVPYSEDHSVLNAYKTATNYPNPSTYTYVEY